ncbi:MAG: acyl carrier protein [Rhodospirillales bacterium]|nr:acyl carrier protein [Rhodospirillales bacterium]
MGSYTEEIIGVINETCGEGTCDLSKKDTPLVEIGLDSLDYVTVVMALEDKFDVEIPQTSDNDLWSIADLDKFLASKVH